MPIWKQCLILFCFVCVSERWTDLLRGNISRCYSKLCMFVYEYIGASGRVRVCLQVRRETDIRISVTSPDICGVVCSKEVP